MNITLVDINEEMVIAWKKEFSRHDNVVVRNGPIEEVECDAIVSPANSFGFMDGGVDLNLSEHLGWQVQETLQKRILERHHGELHDRMISGLVRRR